MTDYYDLCDAGLIALLKSDSTMTSFFPNASDQVTSSDDTVLDNGNNYYAITYPGAFPQTEEGTDFVEYSWEILLDLLVRWNDTTKQLWTDFKAFRWAVINLLNHTLKGQTLDKTSYVRGVVIVSEERPRYVPLTGTGPDNPIFTHVHQVCVVTVRQIVPKEY